MLRRAGTVLLDGLVERSIETTTDHLIEPCRAVFVREAILVHLHRQKRPAADGDTIYGAIPYRSGRRRLERSAFSTLLLARQSVADIARRLALRCLRWQTLTVV